MHLSTTRVDAGGRGFFGLLVLIAGLFAWTAMAPALDNGFTNWDERHYIVENAKIRDLSPSGLKTIFTTRDIGMYSPLSTFSYALNYRFSGLEPRAYHRTDLALHILNTALVMVFVRLLAAGPWPAFAAGLLFAVHPAHVESVAWAAERKDLLYSLFFLAALCLYASGRGLKDRAGVFALFALSVLAKPQAVTLPLALLLVDWYKEGRVTRAALLEKLPFFAVAAAAAAGLLLAKGDPISSPLHMRAASGLYNLGFYIVKLAWPFRLSVMYNDPPGGLPGFYAAAIAVAASAALILKYRPGGRAVLFGLGLYTALLLPVIQFFPFGPSLSADRYTYLSSLGIFFLAGLGLEAAYLRSGFAGRRTLLAGAAMMFFVFAAQSRARCAVWRDSISLWSDTLLKAPASGQALVSLCAAYLQGGRDNDAADCLAVAAKRYPQNADTRFNIGLLAARRRDFKAARAHFETALKLSPGHAPSLRALSELPKK